MRVRGGHSRPIVRRKEKQGKPERVKPMRNVIALIAAMAVLANSSIVYAKLPSGSANPSNVSWTQQQAGGYVGAIWGDLLSADANEDAQTALDASWLKYFGSLTGVPSYSGKKVSDLWADQIIIELLLIIVLELHQCPTQSCHC